MRRFFCLLVALQVFFPGFLFSQPVDTTNRSYDSVRRVVEQTVRDYQDSLERERLLQNIQKHGKPLDAFLEERKKEERKEERRRWIRIGAGALLLFALFFAIARRSRYRKHKE